MGNKKILIADDEPSIRQLAHSLLDKDYIVIGANDGAEAIDIARREKPDLILMDIMMPKVDGYMACYTLKSDPGTKSIPIVMLTAVGHELNKKLSQQLGAQGYITKPFKLQELLELITQILSAT